MQSSKLCVPLYDIKCNSHWRLLTNFSIIKTLSKIECMKWNKQVHSMFQKLNMFHIRFHINFKILPIASFFRENFSLVYMEIVNLSSIEPDNRNQNHAHCVLKKCSRHHHHHQYSLAFQKFNLSCLSKKWPVFWPFLSIKSSSIASRRYMSCFTCACCWPIEFPILS